ncbi:MAG: histone H1 [archaeon]|nr:histone H1 [archaeon]MDA1167443.1 histone H1 [archaeon]
MTTIVSMLEDMVATLNEAMKDAVKSDKGNKTAGTRVRKVMQDIKRSAQDVRNQIQEIRTE